MCVFLPDFTVVNKTFGPIKAIYLYWEKYTNLVLKIFNNISWLYDYASITKAKQETNWDVLIDLANKIKDVVTESNKLRNTIDEEIIKMGLLNE